MFSENTFQFFNNLSKNQNTLWFHANKPDYEKYVRVPMQELISELSIELKSNKINLKGDPRKAIFRINRDVRFSKIKAPYKTNIGASLTHDGDRHTQPVFYIHISSSECFLGVGAYMPEKEMLLSIRNKIVNNQKKFIKIIDNLKKEEYTLSEEEKLVRLPRGFEYLSEAEIKDTKNKKNINKDSKSKVDDIILDNIRYKSFILKLDLSRDMVKSKEFKNTVINFAKITNDFMKFLT